MPTISLPSLRLRLVFLVLCSVGLVLALSGRGGSGTVATAALILAWFGSDVLIVRELDRLARIAKAAGEGDSRARAELRSERNGLRPLFQAFDEMAVRLEQAAAGRRQAEQARRESEEQYRAVVENSADAIAINVGTDRVFVNSAFVKLHGLGDASEAIGTPLDRFILPGDRELVRERTLARQRGEFVPGMYEYRIRRPDGEVRTAQTSAAGITYQGRPAALAIIRDITDLKKVEEELRASEEKFRAVVETANDAIVCSDRSGNVTYFNAGAERIFQYTAGEMAGRPLTALMPERFRDAHKRALDRFLATGEGRILGKQVELAGRRKDGSEFPLELSIAGWRTPRENCFTGILRDISERKKAELELAERGAQLELVNRELEAFSYSVAHDLRAPLRSIDGFSQALLEDYADRLDEQGRAYLRRARAACQRMAQLIDDLLNLSRITRAEMRRETVDLTDAARAIAVELGRTRPRRGVDFIIAENLAADGDARLLRLVLENLLGNAWKFTGHLARAKIEFGAAETDGRPVYFVRDNGAGFDMAYADKLFGAFQRLHAVEEFEGSGIGLATVQRIIHRHGGRVWAEGAPQRGATFYFTL